MFNGDQGPWGQDYSGEGTLYVTRFVEHQAGFTTPELYLINAEAKVRDGDGPGAIATLNLLLEKRMKNFIPLVYTNDAATLERVKAERRKELRLTGKTLIDYKRYHALGETVPTFTRTTVDGTFTLEPGSSKYIVPISDKIKMFNPNID